MRIKLRSLIKSFQQLEECQRNKTRKIFTLKRLNYLKGKPVNKFKIHRSIISEISIFLKDFMISVGAT